MAIIGMEGFDYYETANTDLQVNATENYTLGAEYDGYKIRIQEPGRFGEGKYLKLYIPREFRVNTAGTGITNRMYVSCAIRFTKELADTEFLYFYNDSDIGHVWIKISDTAKLRVRTGNGNILGQSTKQFNLNVWYWMEVYCHISNTGSVDIKIDGVDWLNVTGDTKVGGTDTIDHFAFAAGDANLCIDDLVWQDVNGGYLGDSKIETLTPVGDTTINWSNTGGGAHWVDVELIGSDAVIDADYVYTPSNALEYYTYDTISADSIVHAVAINYRALRDDTGARDVTSAHTATSGQVGATKNLTTGALFYSDVYEDDGSVPWTQTSIGGTHFGIKDIT